MGSHPINLAVRFILELIALASSGFWAWKQSDGWFPASFSQTLLRYLALGIASLLMAFNISHDAAHGSFSKSKIVNNLYWGLDKRFCVFPRGTDREFKKPEPFNTSGGHYAHTSCF